MKFHRRRAAIVATMIAAPALACAVAYRCGLREAHTPSLPAGIYLLTSNPNDPLVSFCPRGLASTESSERGYREVSPTCPDHHAPLLKPVAAKPGDTVEVIREGIRVNGHLLPNSRPSAVDGKNRAMHIWPAGKYTVAPDSLWVISTYNKASYDSRYYGPIHISDVSHYGHQIWRF